MLSQAARACSCSRTSGRAITWIFAQVSLGRVRPGLWMLLRTTLGLRCNSLGCSRCWPTKQRLWWRSRASSCWRSPSSPPLREADKLLMGECDGCVECDEDHAGDIPHIRLSEPAVDYLWWSMDGGWLDDRRYNHGDHHNWPAVDTGGIQHWRVHAAPLRPEGRVTRRLLWASRSRHGATWCSWQCPVVGPRRLVAGAPSPLHRDRFGYNHCWHPVRL